MFVAIILFQLFSIVNPVLSLLPTLSKPEELELCLFLLACCVLVEPLDAVLPPDDLIFELLQIVVEFTLQVVSHLMPPLLLQVFLVVLCGETEFRIYGLRCIETGTS